MDFASELARKLGGAPPKPPSPVAAEDDGENEWGDKPKKKGTIKPVSSHMAVYNEGLPRAV